MHLPQPLPFLLLVRHSQGSHQMQVTEKQTVTDCSYELYTQALVVAVGLRLKAGLQPHWEKSHGWSGA